MLNRCSCLYGEISVQLIGGFGNQLFQFALATKLGIENNRSIVFSPPKNGIPNRLIEFGLESDSSYLPLITDGELKFQLMERCKKKASKKFLEKEFHFSPIELPARHMHLIGYFQSEKYFLSISPNFREFIKNKLFIPEISNRNLIAIQVRLGDMAKVPEFRKVHGLINDDYIRRSLDLFKCTYNDVKIYCDDFESIRRELPVLAKSNPEYAAQGSDIAHFVELASSPNIVISNSTFGWWAAWLGQGKVVAPINWFSEFGSINKSTRDLYLSNWNLL